MSSDGIERAAHAPHRADEIGEAFEREVLAVQRDQHGVGGDERVERQQAERRRAVDEDVVELGAQRIEDALQPVLALRHRDQLDLGAGQIAIGRHERQVRDACRQDIRRRRRASPSAAPRRRFPLRSAGPLSRRRSSGCPADRCRRAAPWTGKREGGGEVDGGRGLADAALLVGDGDDTSPRVGLVFCHITECVVLSFGGCGHESSTYGSASSRESCFT